MQEEQWWQQCSWDIGGRNVKTQVEVLVEKGVALANLTHHLPGCQEVQELTALSNTLSWSVHVSSKSLGSSVSEFEKFKQLLTQVNNLRELLVVSGNPRPKRDCFQVVEQLSTVHVPKALAVSAHDLPERVLRKVSSPYISHIYLQLVSEPTVYEETLSLIRKMNPTIMVSYSWLIPTRANWSALTFRPWCGSLLSERWLADFHYAEHSAQLMLEWCQEQNVKPLIEPRRLTETSFVAASHFHY